MKNNMIRKMVNYWKDAWEEYTTILGYEMKYFK